MTILVRAIITGFGLKLGSEIARRIADRFTSDGESEKKRDAPEEEDMMPSELSTDGPSA